MWSVLLKCMWSVQLLQCGVARKCLIFVNEWVESTTSEWILVFVFQVSRLSAEPTKDQNHPGQLLIQ